MTFTALDSTIASVLFLLFLYLKHSKTPRTSNLPLPPGPRVWPIIGSFLSLPNNSEPHWIWFTRWANKTASDVIHCRVFGVNTIVLNSREAAVDLLERRSNIYSDRPRMVMAGELVGWNRMVAISNYSDRIKTIRKYMHNSISSRTSQDWQPQQEQEAIRFLQKLRRSPENLISHIRHTAGATVVRLVYAYTPKDEDDEYIKIAERAMGNFSLATTPGMFLVDLFPLCTCLIINGIGLWYEKVDRDLGQLVKYLPWAPFKRTALEWRKQLFELIDVPMAFARDQMNRGVAEPSFVSKWLDEPGRESDKLLIPFTAASLYAGGANTTVSAISTFFVAMLHYPEAQKLAQKEIDEVFGKDRLPTLADRDSLPYVEALYKEVLRWQPLGPLGVPHRLGSDVDDEYRGMRIPANSIVIPNIWNMLHDPSIYPSPETFDPSRYFGTNQPNPEDVAFGFGRRMRIVKPLPWDQRG
ncbi:unnamed protein product [Rhizoctonia solani]|uniref:O-methylsterigmatocystin oxidoreductase n=1 Tax=Rhizoctonia solani TaxID=456999 RepID=A0A8H3I1K3_9AGAM|nr:unnamed protein product [Rhizoctonia solani]